MYQWSSLKIPEHSFGIPWSPQASLSFTEYTNLCTSQGLTFLSWVFSTYASRAWTPVSTCHSWFSSQRSRDVIWFSEQSAIVLAFSVGWCVIPIRLQTAVDVFGPSLFMSNFSIGHRTWVVTSQFPTFVPHCTSASLWVIPLMVLTTKLSVALHAGSRLLATVSLTSFYVLADSPDQIDPYLGPRV